MSGGRHWEVGGIEAVAPPPSAVARCAVSGIQSRAVSGPRTFVRGLRRVRRRIRGIVPRSVAVLLYAALFIAAIPSSGCAETCSELQLICDRCNNPDHKNSCEQSVDNADDEVCAQNIDNFNDICP